jgi:hypothetical protein
MVTVSDHVGQSVTVSKWEVNNDQGTNSLFQKLKVPFFSNKEQYVFWLVDQYQQISRDILVSKHKTNVVFLTFCDTHRVIAFT